MNSWLGSEPSRATLKFWGQSFSWGDYAPINQQARKGFIYFISLWIISQGKHTWIVPCIFCGFFYLFLDFVSVRKNAKKEYIQYSQYPAIFTSCLVNNFFNTYIYIFYFILFNFLLNGRMSFLCFLYVQAHFYVWPK